MNKIEKGLKEAKENKVTSYTSVEDLMKDLSSKRDWHWYDYLRRWWNLTIWNRITDLKWQLPTMWHRAFNGWGFADTWDMPYYMSKVIYEMLVHQKKHQHGYIIWKDNFSDEQNQKLSDDLYDEMIYAFKLARDIEQGEREFYLPKIDKRFQKEAKCLNRTEDRKMRKGMNLFVKHFFKLWD